MIKFYVSTLFLAISVSSIYADAVCFKRDYPERHMDSNPNQILRRIEAKIEGKELTLSGLQRTGNIRFSEVFFFNKTEKNLTVYCTGDASEHQGCVQVVTEPNGFLVSAPSQYRVIPNPSTSENSEALSSFSLQGCDGEKSDGTCRSRSGEELFFITVTVPYARTTDNVYRLNETCDSN